MQYLIPHAILTPEDRPRETSEIFQADSPATESVQEDPAFQFSLEESSSVLLRPITPDDKARLQNGLELVSAESRYLRFFAAISQLGEAQLRYLTEVDQVNHVAWGAIDPSAPEHPGLGVGRFIRLDPESPIAEMAITVIDAYQRRGLGSLLLAVLYLQAADRSVETLRANGLIQNKFLMDRLKDLGADVTIEGGLFQADLPVNIDFSMLLDTPFGRRFKRLLAEVKASMNGAT